MFRTRGKSQMGVCCLVGVVWHHISIQSNENTKGMCKLDFLFIPDVLLCILVSLEAIGELGWWLENM